MLCRCATRAAGHRVSRKRVWRGSAPTTPGRAPTAGPRPDRPGPHRREAEPETMGRHHLRQDLGRVGLPGHGDRLAVPSRGRVGHHPRPPTPRSGVPQRSRQAISDAASAGRRGGGVECVLSTHGQADTRGLATAGRSVRLQRCGWSRYRASHAPFGSCCSWRQSGSLHVVVVTSAGTASGLRG